MKKKKLRLKDLKLKSFVTSLDPSKMSETTGGKAYQIGEESVVRRSDIKLSWDIRVHSWTISEVRNDGRPYDFNDDL